MLLLKRKKPESSAPTKSEQAIEHRRKQGRGPLDRWDMFANVMATRNSLDPSHPSHLSLHQVTEATAQEVHRATNLPLPDVFAVRNESGHASTSGGYRERHGVMTRKPVVLTMKQQYGQKALDQITQNENTDGFRKVVRTVAHEMTHVQQRHSAQVMATTTSPQREMQAYGNEIANHPHLPALQGPELAKTVKKFKRERDEVKQSRSLSVGEKDLNRNVRMRVKIGKGVGM